MPVSELSHACLVVSKYLNYLCFSNSLSMFFQFTINNSIYSPRIMDESEIASVTEHFELSESRFKQVSDCHVEEISTSSCEKWRSLPPYLEMETIVAKDIDRDHPGGNECEKRCSFLKKWKSLRGLKATYRSLISALLKVKCREEAEYVCKLLKKRDSNKHLQSENSTYPGNQKSPQTKGIYHY